MIRQDGLRLRVDIHAKTGRIRAHTITGEDVPRGVIPIAWACDQQRVRRLAQTRVVRSAHAAVSAPRQNPRAVRALTRYAEALVALGPTPHMPDLLALPFWIDRLTVRLVALQRWDEAAWWLTCLHRLSEAYWAATAGSLRHALARRTSRCTRVDSDARWR